MKKLGKYEVLGELGHGAMGVVYCARDPIINRLVAVKTITTGVAGDPALLQRFYREAQSAGGLQHPNIVTIYDMGDQGDVPFIAMELVEGENLEQIIARRAPLPMSLKLVYAMQACCAFDYAHKRGIVHRDIKPGNVMVNKDGTVKVVDFGIARVLEASKTLTGMLIGTFAYMSPEQYHGEHADERSDIWSFGVLLYELLCYQRPFTGETPASLMHSICNQQPSPLSKFLPECPPELEVLASKILQKSPNQRYQTMEELLLDLEPVGKKLQAQSVADLVDASRRFVEQNQFTEARDLLRQALQVDSANQKVRTMLERVNAEVKRILARPKAQQYVEKGHALLQEGKIQDANIAAESALQLDSSFQPAQDLQRVVQQQLERAQLIAGWLDAARQYMAEGLPDEAEAQVAKVLEAEPGNDQAATLQQEVAKEKAEREKRLRLLESLQHARGLWTHQKYSECIQLLVDLEKEFPDDEEVPRLLETVREDQAEQRQQALVDCRNLLSARHYEDCLTLLAKLQEQFPLDQEISRLLEDAHKDQTDHRRLQGLAEARAFFAVEQYDEGVSLLTALSEEFPNEPAITELLDAAREKQQEHRRKQSVVKARELLAARRYAECASLLMALKKEFSSDDEIQKLLCAVRDAQAEQRKREGLAQARKLLAARRYDESIAVLNELQLDFSAEPVIAKLLETARGDRAEQQKQQKLAEARARLAAQSFSEAMELLDSLATTYPNDAAVLKLRSLVQREQEKHARNERIQRELDALKKLMNERNYAEVISRTQKLLTEFPGDTNFKRLAEFASSQQEHLEKDLLFRKTLEDAKALFAAHRFEEAIRAAQSGLKNFPAHPELLNLCEQAEMQHRKVAVRQHIEERIREIKVKINREELSEAIDLAKQTLVTLGPDTHVTQLLNSARVEFDAREKKREQGRTLETIRTLIESGDLEAASQTIDQALETNTLETFDPRIQRLSEQIKDAKSVKAGESAPNATPIPPSISREYAFLQGPPPPITPASPQKTFLKRASTAQGAAAQPALSPQPVAPITPPQDVVASPAPGVQPQQPVAAGSAEQTAMSLQIPTQRIETQRKATSNIAPARAMAAHQARVPFWRRPAVFAVLALGLVAAIWAGLRSFPSKPVPPAATTTTANPQTPKPDSGQLEPLERQALNAAGELIAKDDLNAARSTLSQAATLHGPLASEIQKRISAIDESLKDPNLRQLRHREELLWQKALKRIGENRYTDALTDLHLILIVHAGGVHREEAQRYVDQVIPGKIQERELVALAHLDLSQGEFQAARGKADQLKKNGTDTTQLRAEIDRTERFKQLQGQFNELRQRDDDAAVQGLNALWPQFQELAAAGGPGEAVDYMNAVPDAMSEVQARMQEKNVDAVFQRMVGSYQQANSANDKDALSAARTDFQSIVKGGGPHTDAAKKYLSDITGRLAGLNQRGADDAVRAAILRYSQAFEHRDAAALKDVWPAVGSRYEGIKTMFDASSSIQMRVDIESVDPGADGATAVVKAHVVRDQTPIGSKIRRDRYAAVFHLAQINRSWIITDVK